MIYIVLWLSLYVFQPVFRNILLLQRHFFPHSLLFCALVVAEIKVKNERIMENEKRKNETKYARSSNEKKEIFLYV